MEEAEASGKIPFLPFIGVGPRRYLDFFSLDLSSGRPIMRKDNDDKPIVLPKTERPPRVPLIPLNFLEREDKLMDDYKDVLKKLQGKPNSSPVGLPNAGDDRSTVPHPEGRDTA
jgi:cytidine deaminase